MQMRETIEELITRELKELCVTCIHAEYCAYRRRATRAIIQCELFESGQETTDSLRTARGLCISCDHAAHCTLPARKDGAWRCERFTDQKIFIK